jgi:xylan 1,4-beta-xylosidase
LTSQYVKNFVNGMQGNDTNYLKVSACCKHCKQPFVLLVDTSNAFSVAAYSLDDWQGVDRCYFNAVVTPQDLQDTYLPGVYQKLFLN